MTARLVLPDLDPEMHAIAIDPTRHRVVNCGRRRGKSTMGIVVAIDSAWRGGRVLWASPTYRQSDESFTAAKTLLAPVVVVRVKESVREIAFPSGGVIRFASGDEPANLRGGLGWDLAVLDEFAHAKPDLWPTLRPSLAERRGRGLFLSTPRGPGDEWHAMVKRGDGSDPEWRSWTLPTSSAPWISEAELASAREDMSPSEYAREFDALFTADDAVLFPTLVRGLPPECDSIVLGCDLAISQRTSSDHTCVVVAGLAADGTAWILAAQRGHWTMRETCERIAALANQWRARVVAVERVAYQAAAVDELQRMPELRDVRVDGIVPKGDKQSRAAPLSSRVASGAIRFAESLPEWFVSEVTGFPLARRDDAVDAMQLAYVALNPARHFVPEALVRRAVVSPDAFPVPSGSSEYVVGVAVSRATGEVVLTLAERTDENIVLIREQRVGSDAGAMLRETVRELRHELSYAIVDGEGIGGEAVFALKREFEETGVQAVELSKSEERAKLAGEVLDTLRANLPRPGVKLTLADVRAVRIRDDEDGAGIVAAVLSIQRTGTKAGGYAFEASDRGWSVALAISAALKAGPYIVALDSRWRPLWS